MTIEAPEAGLKLVKSEPEFKSASIALKNIVQTYPSPQGTVKVLDGIDLYFDGRSINMLLGPSGCGKSTLLRMMGGVRPMNVKSPTSGEVFIHATACYGPHEHVVTVFQKYNNRPDLTLFENVAFPFRAKLWRKKYTPNQRDDMVWKILEAVGLKDRANLKPDQLSGGQNQRVALARALVLRPRILLMDEPFGALDAQTREEMQHLLIKIWNDYPCQIVFVTHDVDEALLLGDRIVILSKPPATIAEDFTIDEPKPRSAVWVKSEETHRIRDRIRDKLHG